MKRQAAVALTDTYLYAGRRAKMSSKTIFIGLSIFRCGSERSLHDIFGTEYVVMDESSFSFKHCYFYL